jgi:hypothetical protein
MRVKNAMNNIYVRYLGREISIAQHVHSGHTIVQEIGILPSGVDMHIVRYDAVLPSLIAALQEIQDEIERDIWGDKPHSEGHVAAAQKPTGSAAQEGQ